MPVLSFRKEPLKDSISRFSKRVFDIIFSSLVIIFVLSWLFPLIGLLIILSSKGPILFKQKRSGLDNKEFWCYKFRSMSQNIEADNKQATKGDARITTIGSFLRKTSLDEFPQFINVLIGDMSIVGPRPLFDDDTQQFDTNYMRRLNVLPGITGLLQINERNTSDFEIWYKYDMEYIENWSLYLDLKIILLTPFSIFSKK